MNKIRQPTVRNYILLSFFVVFMGCTNSTPESNAYELSRFTENDVEVVISIDVDTPGKPNLLATFTPTKRNHHLFSKDLPLDGVDGVGRPTRLEIVSGNVQTAGDLEESVSATASKTKGLSEPLLMYPEGPVTLRLPIRTSDTHSASIKAELSVTYMICNSEGGCKPPVQDKRITVDIPSEVWEAK